MDRLILIALALLSALALIAALVGQYVFGLDPCVMCLYQRVPFILSVLIAAIALLRPALARMAQGGIAALMVANASLALYHTGIEQKWWASALEGCKVNFDALSGEEDFLSAILSAPTARCDEIAWADPLLGLSMANYNIAFCLGLAGVAIYGAIRSRA